MEDNKDRLNILSEFVKRGSTFSIPNIQLTQTDSGNYRACLLNYNYPSISCKSSNMTDAIHGLVDILEKYNEDNNL